MTTLLTHAPSGRTAYVLTHAYRWPEGERKQVSLAFRSQEGFLLVVLYREGVGMVQFTQDEPNVHWSLGSVRSRPTELELVKAGLLVKRFLKSILLDLSVFLPRVLLGWAALEIDELR